MGAFLTDHYDATSENFMQFYLSSQDSTGNENNISETFKFAIAAPEEIDQVKQLKRSKIIDIGEADYRDITQENRTLKVNMLTNIAESFSINFSYDPSPLNKNVGIFFAIVILLGMYILIIWELVHRTFAAMIASTLAIGVLAMLNERPTMSVIISWIDTETLLLLFGMMILVAVLAETGVFDYLAVYAFKVNFS
jgi:P protein